MKFNFIHLALLLSASFLNIYAMDNAFGWDDDAAPRAATITRQIGSSERKTNKNEDTRKNENESKNTVRELVVLAQDLRHNEDTDIEKSRILFHRAIASSPNPFDQAKAYQGLAKTYRATDPKQSIKFLEKAIQLAPNFPDYYFTAGDIVGFTLQNKDKALDYFRKGYEKCYRNQEHKKTWYFNSLGSMYYDIVKDKQEAKKYYEMGLVYCLKSNPKQAAKFHRLVGSVNLDFGNLGKTRYHLQEAMAIVDYENYNETLVVHAIFAKVLAAMKNLEGARRVFEDGLAYSKNPKYSGAQDRTRLPIFYDEYATFCHSVSQNKRASQVFEEGIKACENVYAYETSQLYKHYGQFLEESRNFDAAKQNYKQGFKHALKRKPEYSIDLAVDLSRVWIFKANEAKSNKYKAKALELVKKISPLREAEIVSLLTVKSSNP